MKNNPENDKIVNAQNAGNIISADEKLVADNTAKPAENKEKMEYPANARTSAPPVKVRNARAETY